MRLTEERIDSIAKVMVKKLIDDGYILFLGKKKEDLEENISKTITEELAVEDKINEEVKEIMRTHTDMMDKDGVDYRRMFQMIKKKLIRERGVII